LGRIISAGADPYVWEGKDCGIEDHGLTFLSCLSTVFSGRLALLELYPFDFLYAVSNFSNTMELSDVGSFFLICMGKKSHHLSYPHLYFQRYRVWNKTIVYVRGDQFLRYKLY
jgi:hypothetical protein